MTTNEHGAGPSTGVWRSGIGGLLSLLPGLATGHAGAQELAALPAWTADRGGQPGEWPFIEGEGRSQQQRAAELFECGAQTVTGVRYRLPCGGQVPDASRIDGVRVFAGHARWSLAAMSTRFSANRGSDHSVCFAGSVALPRTHSLQCPTPFAVRLPFARPFAVDPRRGDLLLEVVRDDPRIQNGVSLDSFPGVSRGSWHQHPIGGRLSSGLPLRLEVDGAAAKLVPGGELVLETSGADDWFATLACFGFVGDRWNGRSLPIDLGPLGASGNTWHVGVMVVRGMALRRQGGLIAASLRTPIPSHSGTRGRQVRVQACTFDRTANALGLVASDVVDLVVGTGSLETRMLVRRDLASPVGEFLFGAQGGGPVVALETTRCRR